MESLLRALAASAVIGLIVGVIAFAVSLPLGLAAPAMRGAAFGALAFCLADAYAAFAGLLSFADRARKKNWFGSCATALAFFLGATLTLIASFAAIWLPLWPDDFQWLLLPGEYRQADLGDLSILRVDADGWFRGEPLWLWSGLLAGIVAMPGSWALYGLVLVSWRLVSAILGGLWAIILWAGRGVSGAGLAPKQEEARR